MISKEQLQTILKSATRTGADFAEIFLESTEKRVMQSLSGEIYGVSTSEVAGAGIRIIKDLDEMYGYTNIVTFDSLNELALELSKSFAGKPTKVLEFNDEKPYNVILKRPMKKIPNSEKAQIIRKYSKIIKDYDERIVQAGVNLVEWEQKILVVNNKGIYQSDYRPYIRISFMAVAQSEKGMQDSFEAPGAQKGFEFIDEIDGESIAKEVAESAIRILNADEIKPEKMTVVLNNGFGGVIFHEACGHPLEASSVSKGLSPFTGKLGEKIASDVVTAYDDGTLQQAWGHLNFDDEGTPTKKNLLIENGILKGYLVDYRNGKRMNMESSGSSRRQSYKYSPTSRMNTTYIAPGKSKFEDLIKNTEYGLFAKKLGGGSVQPATGEFNFQVMEGYYIRNGKIAEPVKGAMLIGYGAEVLKNIDMVADNIQLGQGMCGASSGSIPTDVGQPAIRVLNMTVGGGGQ